MVAMTVWPTDAADGSVANEARWRKMARHWMASGVVSGIGSDMLPTLAYPNLTVRSGAVWVDGHYTELASDQVLTVTANGLAVARFDPAANLAELVYRDAVSVPAQTVGGVWEVPIAQIVGSALVDRRAFAAHTGTAWTALTLASGWANLGAEWATAAYRVDGDRVELRGLIARTPVTIGIFPIAQFAVGLRPPTRLMLTAQVNQGIARVDMGGTISGSIPSGELRLVTAWSFAGTTADLGLLSLAGLSWSLST